MLNVFQSNRLEALVTILSEQVKIPASQNIFLADTVMVQSPGMSQWLKLQLAQSNGIVANIDFPLPSSFIWRLYQNLLQGVPAQSPFNKDRMTWKVYKLLPERIEQSEFDAVRQYLQSEQLTTVLRDNVLNDELQAENPERVSTNMQLRRYQLAQKIADVFDNYLMYRQHWLDHWLEGNNDLPADGSNDDIKHQEWQAILWRDVVAETDKQYQFNENESPLHRAQMHQQLIDVLQNESTETIKKFLPPRLFVFGISTMPSHQLDVLNMLSEHIDVQILWLNPCGQYWGDILSDKTLARLTSKQAKIATTNIEQKQQYFVVGNPLLASWGRIGRDYLDALTNSDFNIRDVFIETDADSLLTNIQNDILNLEFREQQEPLQPEQLRSDLGKKPLQSNDDSILIHNCHSRYRELEVLKDKLLGWFEQDTTLMPKDILVMVPNVDQYAPFIDAVFSSRSKNRFNDRQEPLTSDTELKSEQESKLDPELEPEKSTYIPYTIADRGGLMEEPLLSAFTQFLRLPESRFTVSEIVDYLELPVLMNKFDITSQELELIKFWLSECHIRWAKDAQHKSKWGLPEINLNTWKYGLQRMVLGYALGNDAIWHNILAYQHIEGLNANVLAKLLDYFQFVIDSERMLADDKTIEQWHDVIEQLLTSWLGETELSTSEQISSQKVRDANLGLLEYHKQNDFNGLLCHKIIYQFFSENLNEGGVAQRFLAGSMNFCTLMPMRSVPFKIVCVLGLNEGDYPRQVEPISFDLVGLNTPRKGDRSRKFDDRYLFLEALISARQKLHLSYVGQSSKNNQALMPSVILSELMDYCQQSHKVVSPAMPVKSVSDQNNTQETALENYSTNISVLDHIVIKHKLQPYDNSYYQSLLPSISEGDAIFNKGSDDTNGLYQAFDSTWFNVAAAKAKLSDVSTVRSNSDLAVIKNSDQNAPTDRVRSTKISDDDQIDLSDLITFWAHPIKYFYRNVLDVKLDLSSNDIDDNEVFEHDGLTQYQALQKAVEMQLFNSDLQGQSHDQLQDGSQKSNSNNVLGNESDLLSGAFPNKRWGKLFSDKYQNQAAGMLASINELLGYELTAHTLNLAVELDKTTQSTLTGSIQIYSTLVDVNSNSNQPAGQPINSVTVRQGEIRPQDKLTSWLIHLGKCANLNSGYTFIVDKKASIGWFEPMTQSEAIELLMPWLNGFTDFKSSLLKWHIALGLTHTESKLKGMSDIKIQQELGKQLVKQPRGRNLSNDEYAKNIFKSVADLPSDFAQFSMDLCQPLTDAYNYATKAKAKKALGDRFFNDAELSDTKLTNSKLTNARQDENGGAK